MFHLLWLELCNTTNTLIWLLTYMSANVRFKMSPDVHMYMHFWYAYLLLLCEQWYLYNYIRNNRFVTYANTDKTFWYYSLGVVHVWARWLCFSHLTCWLMLMIFHRILLFNSLLSMDWWFRSLRVTLFKYLSTIIYSDFSSFYISHNFENNPELCVPIVFMLVYLVAYN